MQIGVFYCDGNYKNGFSFTTGCLVQTFNIAYVTEKLKIQYEKISGKHTTNQQKCPSFLCPTCLGIRIEEAL